MIESYFKEIILSLSENPYIESFTVIKEKITSSEGYLRLKANIINNDLLEISFYCQKKESSVDIIDYRYHWQDEKGFLKRRWDNCKHHREIKSFPFHIHMNNKTVKSSNKISILEVLDIIEKTVKDST